MNAGAEYVVYRIWAALQDDEGIHAESLLTCLGALAGYACQASVRQTIVNVPLVESPMSVWALVRRAVEKLDEPLPDIQGIVRHVTQTVGTSAFGVPRVPDGHRPHRPAIDYLKQIWPQILPIAQRFCRKPAQIPVLFGIALQRAIEETKDVLSPTLGATIAMESAVAMSKVVLPRAYAGAELMSTPESLPLLEPVSLRTTPARSRRRVSDVEESAPGVRAFVARLSPTARMVTVVSVATIAIAGAMYESPRSVAPAAAREVRALVSQNSQQSMLAFEQSPQEAQVSEEQQVPEEVNAPTAMPGEPAEVFTEYSQYPPEPGSDSSSEIVISDELAELMK